MGRRPIKNWFAVYVMKAKQYPYVVYADTITDARACFTGGLKVDDVVQLNWLALSAMTGCVIPSTESGIEWAKGDLMFQHQGSYFFLTAFEMGVNDL